MAKIDPADLGSDRGFELLHRDVCGEFGRTFDSYG
jgi:hypothetical protein